VYGAVPSDDGTPSDGGDRGHLLVERLRAGDAEAFQRIVTAWSPSMLRLARGFVSSTATAEEVVQEAWLAVITGLSGFEGRSSLRTWVYRIVANLARRRGVRDARVVPVGDLSAQDAVPTVDPRRFRGLQDPWPGGWTPDSAPVPWGPEHSLLAGEVRLRLAEALEQLPDRQRTVVALRDVHGLSSDEVGETLGISPGNQRVLLHRGRARLRQLLEEYLRTEEASA
jgi:RNA polymerase sigma-70 factor (ECF subfamily)